MFFTGYKMATSAEFLVAIIFFSYGIKLSGYFGLLVRVQMAVGLHGSLHPLMSQAFCYQKRCTAYVNQQTGVGMTYIVHPDLLRSGVVTTILHLSADPAPIIREDTVCRLYLVKLCQIVFQAVFQHLRHNQLKQTIERIQQQQVSIKVVEQIEAKPLPLSSKVAIEKEYFQNLVIVAQKYVVQEKQEGKLKKLLREAKKTTADMKAKIELLVAELTAVKEELAQYKSVRGQLRTADLKQENDRLRKRIRSYEDVISKNKLWSYFSKNRTDTIESKKEH